MGIDPLVVWVSAGAPALVFGATAVTKAIAPHSFRALVARYAVIPEKLAPPVAYVLPYIELTVAVGILVPRSRRMAAAAALILLVVFTAALAINLLRGRRNLDCGCHLGRSHTPLSPALLLRNALLMLWILPAAFANIAVRPLGWLDVLTILTASVVGILTYAIAGELLALRRPAVA